MTKSSRLFLFPDINVWLALTYDGHAQHAIARAWFERVEPSACFFFCRFTQLGLLRLLTSKVVMGLDSVRSQRQAWKAYDQWLADERIEMLGEPDDLETRFRDLTRSGQPATKDWADSYLAAFAVSARLTIVTFDLGLRSKANSPILLKT